MRVNQYLLIDLPPRVIIVQWPWEVIHAASPRKSAYRSRSSQNTTKIRISDLEKIGSALRLHLHPSVRESEPNVPDEVYTYRSNDQPGDQHERPVERDEVVVVAHGLHVRRGEINDGCTAVGVGVLSDAGPLSERVDDLGVILIAYILTYAHQCYAFSLIPMGVIRKNVDGRIFSE